jgi:hypothetical protein
MEDSEEQETAVERAKKLWKAREKVVKLDREDFNISKSIASGGGISEEERRAYGENRAIVNMPILDPAVNSIAYRFDSNPFSFQMPEQLKGMADEKELNVCLSKALREILWDGISYVLAYHTPSKIKFRVLDNLNVVMGKCKLDTGEDCKEALCVDKISKEEAKRQYPELSKWITRKSILNYEGADLDGYNDYEEVTFWELASDGVKVSKIISGELADETVLPLTRLPIARIVGKKVRVEKRDNWRGLPYIVRKLLTTLTYMASKLQENIATAPNANFLMAEESANTQELARQHAKVNAGPRNAIYYRAFMDNGVTPIPPPIKVDKTAGIEELSVHIESLKQTINNIVGAAGANPVAGTETAESVLLRRESKETAPDEFLRNLLAGAQGVAAVMEEFFAMFGAPGVKVVVTESIFEKAKQASDSQKLMAFVSFMGQNPMGMDFAEALIATMDLSDENRTRMEQAIEMRKQKEQQNIEQLMQQGQAQAMQLQEAQQQLAVLQKQLQDAQYANFEMQSDSEAKVRMKEMEEENKLAMKQMEIDFKYAELAAKTGTETDKNEIAAAKVANEQIKEIEAATNVALEHPTKGALL